MIDTEILIQALQKNGVKECAALSEKEFSVKDAKFLIDESWMKLNGKKYFLQDFISILNILAYEGLIPRSAKLIGRLIWEYNALQRHEEALHKF